MMPIILQNPKKPNKVQWLAAFVCYLLSSSLLCSLSDDEFFNESIQPYSRKPTRYSRKPNKYPVVNDSKHDLEEETDNY